MCGKGYTMGVNKFLKQIFPAEFFISPAYFRAVVLALVYLGILLAELFHFEEVPGIVEGFALPGGHIVAVLLAGLLPLLAATSLPFLISMKLSNRVYDISRAAVIVTPLVWMVLGVYLNIAARGIDNAGLFGATLPLPAGLWLIVFAWLWLWAAILVVRELPRRKR